MYQKMYGDKEQNQDIVPAVILFDVHEKLGKTCVLISQTRKNSQSQTQIMK